MSAEGVAELYADGPDLMMAASFSPPHRADEVPGGYRITGRGPLATTIHDSRWALMSAIVFDGDRMTPAGPDLISVVMRTAEVEIIDTWDSLGMRGTDSNDIAANGVFVPESRAFRFEPDSVPSAPFDGPLYRMPALAATCPIIAPVALAIARGAIRELRDIVTNKVPLGSKKTARDRGAVQSAVAETDAIVRSARLFFYDALTRAWERAVTQQPFALEDKADLMLASTWAVRSAARATDLMQRMGGTNGIYARSRLERISATRRRCDTTASYRTAAWKPSDRCIWESRRNFHTWRFDRRGSVRATPAPGSCQRASRSAASLVRASRQPISLAAGDRPGGRPSCTARISVPPSTSTSVVVIVISPRSAASVVSNSITSTTCSFDTSFAKRPWYVSVCAVVLPVPVG